MAGEIVSPGDAFSQGFQGVLMQQAALARQKMLDDIAARRESRLEESDQLDTQIRREQLKQKIEEDKDREAANFVKRYQATHVAGDIPDASTLAKAKDLGVEDLFSEDVSKAVAPPPSQTMELPGAVPIPGSTAPPAAVRLAPSRPEAGLRGPQTYPGSAKEQEQADLKTRLEPILKRITSLDPSSPEYRRAVLEYELVSGKSAGSLANLPRPGVGTHMTEAEMLDKALDIRVRMKTNPTSVTPAERTFADEFMKDRNRLQPGSPYLMGAGGELRPTGLPPRTQIVTQPGAAAESKPDFSHILEKDGRQYVPVYTNDPKNPVTYLPLPPGFKMTKVGLSDWWESVKRTLGFGSPSTDTDTTQADDLIRQTLGR